MHSRKSGGMKTEEILDSFDKILIKSEMKGIYTKRPSTDFLVNLSNKVKFKSVAMDHICSVKCVHGIWKKVLRRNESSDVVRLYKL